MASAAASCKADEESVSTLFTKAYDLYTKLMDSGDDFRTPAFQAEVKRCILMLEDVTRGVSLLDLFSRNENVREMATGHIKFFLLPCLLSNLQGKIYHDPETTTNAREDTIDMCETYLRDFLQRIKVSLSCFHFYGLK